MKRDFIRSIYADVDAFAGKEVTLGGWVRNLRDSKAFGFIDLNDGSCFKCVQVVFERDRISNYDEIAKQNVGAAVVVKGTVELTPTMKQPFEIKAIEICVEGTS
ncbi:MAG: asparagine--tRNA ligase, partial [Clostridia bacterium]|nr:asparagine--tRNA ligase [Clostridia bacterium]